MKTNIQFESLINRENSCENFEKVRKNNEKKMFLKKSKKYLTG